ncbi:MAG: hypothetical protein IKK05_07580 [Alistipes sp.]|nr:hypothetical protein [Alistipes sp.]
MKAKHLLFALCAVLFGATSCETLNDFITLPETPETPSAEYYTVSLGFGGEIEVDYEPLRSAENNDLYGINVYSAPANVEGTPTWTNYAYGLFDDPSNIKIDLLVGYQYKFVATMVKDGKEKVLSDNGAYREPFDVSFTSPVVISTSFNYGLDILPGLGSGHTYLKNPHGLYHRPNTERFYGELKGYIPSNNGKATIDMGRTSYGVKFVAQGQSANVGTLEIQMSESPLVTLNLAESNEYFDIYTFHWVSSAWLKSDYSEEGTVNINYIREDDTVVPLGSHKVTFVRNTTTVVTVNIGYGGAENGLGFNITEGGEMPENPNTAITITNGGSSDNGVEIN